MDNRYCIIMAGGIGSRFWPMSTSRKPKQFLDILGTGKTLLQQTYERFTKVCPAENIYIVTNGDYSSIVAEQLPINSSQIISEPLRRNTAPCIAYASYKISALNPDALIVAAPSDHLILKEDDFINTINSSYEKANSDNSLITLGIKPSRPDTGYGYIQFEGKKDNSKVDFRRVKTFTEKPDIKTANEFLKSGDFYWNSGIFIWSVSTILHALDKHMPETNALFMLGKDIYNTPDEAAFISKTYEQCKNISVDYGIMEKAEKVLVALSDFGWSDLGTWGSLYENQMKNDEGNAIVGKNTFLYDSKDCIINMPDDKQVILQGLENYIVVYSNETLLVCKKEDEQKIKYMVANSKNS